MVCIDKFNNVTRDGKTIGRVELEGSVFIGINLITKRQAKSFDYDAILKWFEDAA